MDFSLSEEQSAVFDMARDFGQAEIAPYARQWEAEGTIPKTLWPQVGELGFGGLYVSEASGGAGLSRLDATLVFEALSMACPSVAAFLSIHNMCARMIDMFGTDELKSRLLPDVLSLNTVLSYCLTEPGSGSDASALKTRADRTNDGYVLNGTKAFISGGGYSDAYVCMVRTGDSGPKGISTVYVEDGTPGLSFGALEDKMGWRSQPTAQVQFDDCHVPAGNLLGEEGHGFRYAMMGLDGGRLNIAACSLGAAQTALNQTLAYMGERKAFGQPIDQFQGLQFRLADMEIELAGRAHVPAPGRVEARPAIAGRDEVLRDGQEVRHRSRIEGRRPVPAASWRIRLPRRLRDREAGPRPARAPDPRGHERDHAGDRRPRHAEEPMSDISIRTSGRAGRITLQRPQALNAMTYDMCLAIERAFDAWRDDDAVDLVVLDAEGDKAFCAGGDIAALYETGTKGDYSYGQTFWADEYRLNAKIFAYPKPVVSLLQGFTMGGGVGIGCHGTHRIVGETSQIAMPECGIGLVPDVGGSLMLALAPGRLGEYLGTTGTRMGPGDAIHAGFADRFVPEADWPALIAELERTGSVAAVDDASREPPQSDLENAQPEIDRLFSGETLNDIVTDLRNDGGAFAEECLKRMGRGAPLSMACSVEITHRLRGETASIEKALDLEYRFTYRAMEHGDFLEGIRAQIIDKDRNPKWQYAERDVPLAAVSKMLRPLDEHALKLGGDAP